MQIKVVKVYPEPNYYADKKTGQQKQYWRGVFEWEGHRESGSCFEPITEGMVFEGEMAAKTGRNGAMRWTAHVSKSQPATQPATQPGPSSVTETGRGYPVSAYLALDDEIGKQVQGYADNEDALKSTVYGCMWISMSKDPKLMAEMAAKEGAGGGASSSGEEAQNDDLGPDDNIPF